MILLADKRNEFVINIYFSFDSALRGKLTAEKQFIIWLLNYMTPIHNMHR